MWVRSLPANCRLVTVMSAMPGCGAAEPPPKVPPSDPAALVDQYLHTVNGQSPVRRDLKAAPGRPTPAVPRAAGALPPALQGWRPTSD